MALNFKKADENELDEINLLIFESEILSANGKTDKDVFLEKYTIRKTNLLGNLSYALHAESCIVGFFMITSTSSKHELEYFYIKHNQLGKGYGKILWGYMSDICFINGIQKLSIVCGKNVTAFYAKMGAQKIGEVDSKVNRGVKIDLLQYSIKSS